MAARHAILPVGRIAVRREARMAGDSPEGVETRTSFGPVRVIPGGRGGRYPEGNSLLVEGERESVIIDPSLALTGSERPRVDRVLNSHCHEDHIAGNYLFANVPWLVHDADRSGFRSLDDMMAIYGFDDSADEAIDRAFRKLVVEQFHYTPRADVGTLRPGERFDFGGVSLEVIHTPGHTRGHCCFLIEWAESGATRRLVYLGDIDLSSFGPYYGDAWSDLVDFERSLARVGAIEADWYATFHHIGVVAGRDAFLERLDRYAGVIASREQRLLDFLCKPHDLAEIVAHRFIYRPGDAVGFADPVERRSMGQHIERLRAAGRLRALDGGRFVRC